ncbi:MAG: hypothetical protein JXA21_14075 [Anaerolineae bacterium]|nr:hypothetical protein [Anaerolineae bacterium]
MRNFDSRVFSGFLRLLAVLVVLFVTAGRPFLSSGAPAALPALAPHAPVKDKELVRNGDFDQGRTAWAIFGDGSSVVSDGGPDGSPALLLENAAGDPADYRAFAAQELHLPTQTTAATFAFDFRLLQTGGIQAWFQVNLVRGESLEASAEITSVVSTGWVNTTTSWQHVVGAFSAQDVAAIQSARTSGEHIWIIFTLYQQAPDQFQASLDGVSILVNGDQVYPTDSSGIAFIGMDADGYAKTVNRVNPAGTSRITLWAHPGVMTFTGFIGDVAWNPGGTELAFSSDHESAYSAFNSDVYGIHPCGGKMRRITNPPSKVELGAGAYTPGTVTGKVRNDYGSVATFSVYVQGAAEAISVEVGGLGNEASFSVPDVADLGTTQHSITFIWSNGTDCVNGREYKAAVVDVISGSSVDAGTLAFNGTCGVYNSDSITWKGDGSVLGVDVIAPRAFQVSGQAIGSDLFAARLTSDNPAWSPINDYILYHGLEPGSSGGIFLTSQGEDQGTCLVNDGGALNVTAAWLPDGSGFVYTMNRQLREYTLATVSDKLLVEFYNEEVDNPSVSPDGTYVVFERHTTAITPPQYDLWIVNRHTPAEMWALSTNGRSSNPDWSRTDLPSCYVVYLSTVLR